jgi:hypothetical protein
MPRNSACCRRSREALHELLPSPPASAACASIGCATPRAWTSSTCAPTTATMMIGTSTMCHISIWPKFITLKNAPTPTELNASLPLAEIHCESKILLRHVAG